MSKQISLKNFYSMTGGFVTATADNKPLITKSIKNFIPQYPLLQTESVDTNVYTKTEPAFPLVLTKTESGVTFSGSPSAIISSREANNAFYAISSTGIYSNSSGTNLADFANLYVTTFNQTADIQQCFGRVFISCSNQDYIYYGNVDGSSTGRISGFGTYGVEIPKPLIVFLNGVYAIGGSNGNTLYKIDSTLVKSTVASIENTTIRYGANYNDRYLVYFGTLSQDAQPDGTEWVMLFHDGSTNGLFQYRTRLNGEFIGHTQVGDVHYVFTEEGSDLVCSYIDSFSVTEVARIKGAKHSYPANASTGFNYRNKVSYVQGYFSIVVKHLTDSCVLLWNPKTNESSFIYKDNTNRPRLVTSRTYQSNPILEVFLGSGSVGKRLISYAGATPTDFEYKTNLLQFGERVKISRIDVVMDPTFPTTGDMMTVSVNYTDKLTSPNFTTFQKANITTGYSDTDVQIDTTRVIINNIGIVGTEFAFTLSGIVVTTSWDLVIREIIISYEDVGQLS